MVKDVWMVHGNWTGSGLHSVHVKSGKRIVTRQFASLENARKFASDRAKQEGLKKYGAETQSGRWISRKVVTIAKKKPVRKTSVGFPKPRFRF